MYPQRVRIFGPKSHRPYLTGPPIQKGEGWGSFFGGLAKRFLPMATQGIKRLAKSDLVKDVSNVLMQQGVNAATDIVSNVIEGKENPLEEAKERLQDTRREIANTIRKRKISVSKDVPTTKKRRKKTIVKKKKKKKSYSLFDEFEDV